MTDNTNEDDSTDDEQPYGDMFGDEGIPTEEQSSTYPYMHTSASWWGLGDHEEEPDDTDWDKLFDALEDAQSEATQGLSNMLEEATRRANELQNSRFECGVCGLMHGHDTSKHDVRDFFGVTEAFADMMQYNPYCHCGVHELARLLKYFDNIDVQVFEHEDEDDFDIESVQDDTESAARQAPIRDETRAEIEETLGPL